MVRAMIDGVRVVGLAHRLVWQHLHGDIPDGLVINHKNGIKGCNRGDNLETCSYSENAKHAYRVGLVDEHGQRNPSSTVTDHTVGAIRAAYAAGAMTMGEVARQFGQSVQYVSRVVRGETRARQPGPISTNNRKPTLLPRDPVTGRYLSNRRAA
jgi:hypothetical protein